MLYKISSVIKILHKIRVLFGLAWYFIKHRQALLCCEKVNTDSYDSAQKKNTITPDCQQHYRLNGRFKLGPLIVIFIVYAWQWGLALKQMFHLALVALCLLRNGCTVLSWSPNRTKHLSTVANVYLHCSYTGIVGCTHACWFWPTEEQSSGGFFFKFCINILAFSCGVNSRAAFIRINTVFASVKQWTTTEHVLRTDSAAINTENADEVMFPLNIVTLPWLAATLPVSSATCERSISTLRLLKTHLRSTMTNAPMNGLAMMFIHREGSSPEALKLDNVINEFAARHPRRMELSDLGARQDSE